MLADKIVSLPRTARRPDLPGGEKALLFEKDRINRIVRKVVLGLYWHHEKRRLPPATELEVFKDVPLDEELRQILGSMTPRFIGNGAFHYRYGVAMDDAERTLWLLQFYEKTQFMVATNRPR